jgi:hypothetical protein
MLRRRRSEGSNKAKGVLAVFWIALAAVSGLYLFTLFTNPTAFGSQTAKISSYADATSALSGAGGASLSSDQLSELLEARDKELAEIKQTMRELSQQVADLSANIKSNGEGTSPLASTPPPSPAATPAAPPPAVAAAPAPAPKKPEAVAAAPAITPPPPPEKPEPVVKPAEAKPPEKPAPTPATVVAAEPKPVEPEPKPTAANPPPVTTSEPGEEDADAGKSNIPPPVTVSEADVPPVEETSPSPNLSAPTPPQASTPEAASTPTPPATESAALDPVALPPAANDGSTRYGIEIGTVAKQDALRPLWRTFLTNHAALVAGLQPRRVLAPDKKWRLIAGPFANAAEANQACALFKKASQPCEATVYAGDSL